jgi:hypothetical protein
MLIKLLKKFFLVIITNSMYKTKIFIILFMNYLLKFMIKTFNIMLNVKLVWFYILKNIINFNYLII